jgi:hypothetical protein
MALLSRTPRKQAPLNIYLRVLNIRIHPRSSAFMRVAEVLQGRLSEHHRRGHQGAAPDDPKWFENLIKNPNN